MGTTATTTSPLIVLESVPGSLTTRSSSLAMAAANETLLVVLDKVISPNASNYTDLLMQQPAEVNMTLMALKGTLLLLIILLTITGNLLVLVAIFMNPNLRTTTNYFIVNLAIADLLLGASVLPFSATLELLDKQWYFGQIFCNVWAATDVLCCTASINSLCVISVDRYIGVTRPLTYSSIVTHRRAVTTCVVVWVLSFFISVGPLFGWRDPPNPDLKYSCEVTKQKGYVIFSVLFSFYIPTLVILVVYQRIYRAATRQTKFLETGVKIVKSGGGSGNSGNGELTLRVHQGNSKSSSGSQLENSSNPKVVTMGLQGRLAKFKRQKKAAKTLGIVVGVYFICWFPFFFILPLGSFCEACTVPPLLFDVIFWTGYFNSCLNPFIYATTSREYNRAFRTVLRCNWLCRGSGNREHNATDYQWSNSKTVTYTIRGSSSPQRQSSASTMRPSPLPNHHTFKDIA